MSRVYNFSAGPAALPLAVLEQVRDEMLDWHGCGTSVMEMSHRGKAFDEIAEQAEADLRTLMAIPANYKVLFLQGGASAQFAMIPLNLLGDKAGADYVNTGNWSKKAISEAARYCDVHIAATTEPGNFTRVPSQAELDLREEAAYCHITGNNTIFGTEFHYVPETGSVPLVSDASSHILSRPMDVSRYGLIYAGAQKNIGPAGLTIVIVRDDLIGRAREITPTMFDYQVHADNDSRYNTPPTFAIYVAGLVFKQLLEQGGLTAAEAVNRRKADKLYSAIEGLALYGSPVEVASRSLMNVPFTLADDALDADFLAEAAKAGLVSLKGHRKVGGMRASIYNAMPESGVDALVSFMEEFQRTRA
ncbi:MAG: 3-phosphoserine/phosphohydroxythreonine transaminase [Gammaproteobacteria bacterium]|nr:3-phosphoserine/phosphohydroxythreonine transaminase [Gammaproteobacteria bacterium]